VTSNTAWSAPTAAAPDTWTASTERKELAAHEYSHTWQYSVGGRQCMVGGPRWLTEGMAESLAYRSLVDAGLIPAANMDVFTKRQLRNARYVTLQLAVGVQRCVRTDSRRVLLELRGLPRGVRALDTAAVLLRDPTGSTRRA
jgi:hypothetical protein